MSHPGSPAEQVAEWVASHVVARLTADGQTVATAESLTGGLVCATLVAVPGASAVVRGGLVAYAEDVKTGLLRVPAEVVSRHGTVATETAAAMAESVRDVLGAEWGVATTGVAGPEQVEDKPVGTVHVAVAGPSETRTEDLVSPGEREQVRAAAVGAALRLLRDSLEG